MTDPFSVAGSAVGVISLGLSVCQGLVKYYSVLKGQDGEVCEMVGKVKRLTGLLEALQHRLSSPRYRHSVSVEKVEQSIVACATSLTKLKETLSKCTHEFAVDDIRHKLQAKSRRMLYPFKQKTLQDLSAAVSQCQRDLTSAMQILQIDQLSTVESSNAVILENTATTRDIIQVNSHEVKAMREEIQRLMEVAVPALVLSSMRPQLQGNPENRAATALDMSSANLKPQASSKRTIMVPESYPSLCRCRSRTRFIERQLKMGPVTLVRTSKSRVKHNEDCQYFVPEDQDEGVRLRFQVGTRSRRWNITAALNYNHAVGAFSIIPSLAFKVIVPDNHPSFLVTKDIVRGKMGFEAGIWSIRLLFQAGKAGPNDVNDDGMNVLLDKLALSDAKKMMDDNISVDGAFQERIRQLILAFMALGVNVNERVHGMHVLNFYLLVLLINFSASSDDQSLLYDLREKIAMHRDGDYDPVDHDRSIEMQLYDKSVRAIEAVKEYESVANELGYKSLYLAVLRKSLDDVESILNKSPSATSFSTALKHIIHQLGADWPLGMKTLFSRERSVLYTLDIGKQFPLDCACHYNCVSVVKLLLQADRHIDLNLMHRLEEQSKWELFQIFVEEISHRRGLLRQLAETELSAEKYQDLGISVEHPMTDIQTVLVLAEMEENFIYRLKALDYYGSTPISGYRCYVNVFGSSFGNTVKGAEIMDKAGFLLEVDVPIFREFQIRGQCVHLFQELWPWTLTLAQRLDKMLWLQEKGFTFMDSDVHAMFCPIYGSPSLEGRDEDLIAPYEDRIDLLSQLLSSRSGEQHTCPCCMDVCFPAVAALKTGEESPLCDIKDLEGGRFIFADLLSMVEACKSKLDPEFWVWAMPKLIHSVLYEACRLTHSNDCCRRRWELDEDDITEKQQEEQHMRSRLRKLTEELTAEYEGSSLLPSDFLRDRVVVRALELVDGEEEASPEDRKRLREIGVVLEEESESESDGDEIANDDRLW